MSRLYAGVVLLIAIHLPFVFCGFVAPYGYDQIDPAHVYQAPQLDEPIQFMPKGDSYRLFGILPCERHLFGARAGELVFVMGSDGLGRDLFSRLLVGGAVSLIAAICGVVLTLGLGAAVGALAAFSSGALDAGLMRAADLSLSLPALYLLLAIRAVLPLTASGVVVLLATVATLSAVSWPRPARLVRNLLVISRSRDYVLAARSFGASPLYLVRRHMAPELAGVLLAQGTLLIPQFVLAEVTLSFLGLGVSEPVPSWGGLLGDLLQYASFTYYWWTYLPAVALFPVLLSYYNLSRQLQKWNDRFAKQYDPQI